MKRFTIVLCACFLLFGMNASAVTKRALFMAIDTYKPDGVENTGSRTWNNLEGCVNDARATCSHDSAICSMQRVENELHVFVSVLLMISRKFTTGSL